MSEGREMCGYSWQERYRKNHPYQFSFCRNFKGLIEYDEALILGKDLNSWGGNIYDHISYMPQFAQDGLNPSKSIGNQIELVKSNNTGLKKRK